MAATATVDTKTKFRGLYPAIKPYDTGFLKVDETHNLYYEQCGNPKGKPAVVLHGGPGGGCQDSYRQYFDPEVYRIVLFDQRGCNRSTPHACLKNNTTWHLVADIEQLREKLEIEKWLVFGGSWGAGLAIAYGETYPTRCKALVLRGCFTLRDEELQWFYQKGASMMFPEFWEKFLEPIPECERQKTGNLMSAYYRRLTGDDQKEKEKCASAWSIWEMATSRLEVDPKYIAHAADDIKFCLAFARIECHYFVHGGFLKYDGQLTAEAHKLNGIPGVIVQGRYDMVCPAKTSYDMHKGWKGSELIVLPLCGHSIKEESMTDALIKATDKFREL